ncbi:hypothetical protein KFU94_41680 [Chloroflexi bacterium TSY]|nr:hypothetical protein [Chloroflexi bacterium TSY]
MKKVNSYHSDQQMADLKAPSEVTGMKVAELLRHAVDRYVDHARSRGLLINPNLCVDREDDGVPEVTIEEA